MGEDTINDTQLWAFPGPFFAAHCVKFISVLGTRIDKVDNRIAHSPAGFIFPGNGNSDGYYNPMNDFSIDSFRVTVYTTKGKIFCMEYILSLSDFVENYE